MTGDGRPLHPLSAFLLPWFFAGTPSVAALNAECRERDLVTGNGAPLRFVAPTDDMQAYEERAFRTGEVATRPGNRHDLFNALIWQPLPLLGIPGATADNELPDYYDDPRQFRPPRRMQAGSSPGNR